MYRATCVSSRRIFIFVIAITGPLLCGIALPAQAVPPVMYCNSGHTLTQIRDSTQDLVVDGICYVQGNPDPGRTSLLYVLHNVNVIGGGTLQFVDGSAIDFYAESIVIENDGVMTALSSTNTPGYKNRLTIHLWGAPADNGVECATIEDPANNIGPCGIPLDVWNSNPGMAQHLMMTNPTPPAHPKNAACNQTSEMPVTDCFYQYEVQDAEDRTNGLKAYFGHKVLAVSYGGTLQLRGAKGSIFSNPITCNPTQVGNECNPSTTGKSWVRLTSVSQDKLTLTLNDTVDWKKGDHIVVTATDYLPGHSEEVVLAQDASGNTVTLTAALQYLHNASVYPLPAVDNKNGPTADIGPQDDLNRPDVVHAVDTRAAVGLLSRNIQIVSEGNTPQPDSMGDTFPPTPGNYYGGHTIVRQGFKLYQVQGVEFYRLGQGGAKGRYPVHFHMARLTQQPTMANQPPINYVKDCSIHDSMTRWITLHATEGMYLARNVGYLSIGHGYYLEDATETDNKLYANLGVMARAAVINPQNPRQVPGILADTSTAQPPSYDGMPYRSDFNHPTVFWIMNGWNDFQYNFAAGAATCGACYWWLPGANSGPSQYQHWNGYASQQIWDPAGNTSDINNFPSAGYTPLKNFVGNSCVAAMSSFQTVGATNDCIGVPAYGNTELAAVPTSAPTPAYGNPTQFDLYYPSVTALRNPTVCANYSNPATDCSNGAAPPPPVCDNQTANSCAATVIDHYTTSFNFAQTNFSAVWLRPKWYLVRNSAITDIQTGGLNFVTGGGYTRSDIPLGYWSVVRHSAFIGHSQPFTADNVPANTFASEAGPFNPYSQLGCDSSAPDHCLSVNEGISLQLPPFPGQRMFNIYDGPAFQELNYYLDINTTNIDDCSPGNGTCPNTKWPSARNLGVLQEKPSSCYLPNAAIAWKQPNGFYYPPAFNSKKLWFANVDIRHFVVEPFFTTDPNDPNDPFYQNQPAIMNRYCTYNGDTFGGFNHIDRQTVLNDDDGTLTGLLANENTPSGTITRATISINEDDYFNSPLITPECLSDKGVTPMNPNNLPFTARTSPYDWLSTVITASCALPVGQQTPNKAQCLDANNVIHWAHECTNPSCRGVPLFREYLTGNESNVQPQIRMMGQDKAQRSTLTVNHGAYYIDTTQNCTSQGTCSTCVPNGNPNDCNIVGSSRPTIFQGGQTYYMFFIYAKPSTHQTYDIYVGPDLVNQLTVTPIRGNLPGSFQFHNVPSGGWVTTKPDPVTGTVRVTFDLSSESSVFSNSVSNFCQPASFCAMTTVGGKAACGCAPGNPQCIDSAVCAWGTKELDCPMDPDNPNQMGCYGFSFTLPANFVAPDLPIPPPASLFVNYTTNPYFAKGNVTFTNQVTTNGGACTYSAPPVQP